MLVRYWMTEDPITATEEMTLLAAFRRMKTSGVRRLVVVRGEEACGIISLSDLYRFIDPLLAAAPGARLDLDEHLASGLVSEHMTPSPICCDPNDALEEAGERMRTEKIGALPVLRNGKLTGIITESDMFRAFTELCHGGGHGARLCFRVPVDQKRRLFGDVMELCRQLQLELSTILTHPLRDEDAHLVMLRVQGSRVDELVEALWQHEYQVLQVRDGI